MNITLEQIAERSRGVPSFVGNDRMVVRNDQQFRLFQGKEVDRPEAAIQDFYCANYSRAIHFILSDTQTRYRFSSDKCENTIRSVAVFKYLPIGKMMTAEIIAADDAYPDDYEPEDEDIREREELARRRRLPYLYAVVEIGAVEAEKPRLVITPEIHDLHINIRVNPSALSKLIENFERDRWCQLTIDVIAFTAGDFSLRKWVKVGEAQSSDADVEFIFRPGLTSLTFTEEEIQNYCSGDNASG